MMIIVKENREVVPRTEMQEAWEETLENDIENE